MSDTVYLPPQNIEAEDAVLGGVLLDNKTILDLPAEFTAAMFYRPSPGSAAQSILLVKPYTSSRNLPSATMR